MSNNIVDVNFTLERYDVHISTDRPIYNLNEWVLIRGVLLNGITNHPLPSNIDATCTVKVTSPKGDEVAKYEKVPVVNSVVVGSWKTTEGTSGGDYTIEIFSEVQASGFVIASAKRTFEVREFFAPKMKLQAEFLKKGLGAGDTATAVLHAVRAEGGIPAGAKVTATARIDGAEAWRGETTLDQKGDCRVTFKLPDDIKVGEGTLTFTVQDGGNVESIGKTIPILLATIKVNFYPESGQLINGVETGLYFECFQNNGDPADVKGQLLSIDSSAARASGFSPAATIDNLAKFTRVCELESSHEGRGKVVFTPEKHNTYFMHVSTPGGIRDLIKLPRETCKVHKRGAIILSKKDTYQKDEPVELMVVNNESADYTLKLYKRNVEIASAPVKNKGARTITFYPPAAIGEGVLRATLFKKNTPVAERLIFRHMSRHINVKVTPNKESFKPNQKLQVSIKTTDENNEPVRAILGVNVTDDAILEMVEKRKQAPRLPEMALLESEVNEFWDSQIYFKNEPKSRQAIDLLLGTQGWRRFVFFKAKIDLLDFLAENKSAERVLVATKSSINEEKYVPPLIVPRSPRRRYSSDYDEVECDEDYEAMPQISSVVFSAPQVLSAPTAVKPRPTAVLSLQAKTTAVVPSRSVLSPVIRPSKEKKEISRDKEMKREEEEEARPSRMRSLAAPQSVVESSYFSESLCIDEDDYIKDISYDEPVPIVPVPTIADNEEIEWLSSDKYVARLYRHKKSELRDKTVRTDFTKTLFWAGQIETDSDGEATVNFTLSESITSFRVMVDAFNRNNGFGVSDFLIESKEPFSSDARVPIEVTETDEMLLPILLVNNTKKKFSDAKVAIEVGSQLKVDSKKASEFKAVKLGGNERVRKLLKMTASEPGNTFVKLEAKSGSGHLDKIERQLRIMPLGFPQQVNSSGTIKASEDIKFEFEIPSKISKSSVNASLAFFPSPAGNYEALCDRLCQTPGGCFEQVGSTMFPLILAAQWFANKGDLNKLNGFTPKIKVGYDKIKGYECRGGGFEWYGGTPAHTALTAFGVVMLLETMPVYDVDKGLLDRSVQWLLDQRDGKGEFKQAYGKYAWASPPKTAAHGYIMWALTEAGVSATQVEKELAHLNKLTEESGVGSYVIALAANVNHRLKQDDQAKKLCDKLVSMQGKDGRVQNAGSTIVYSGSPEVESTSLAMLAWMRVDAKAYANNIETAKKYLDSTLSPYGYGNTQATSLTLKAMNVYNTTLADTSVNPSVLSVHFNDKLIHESTIKENSAEPIVVPFTDVKLGSGKHKLHVKLGKGSLPYQFTVSYNALTPNSAADCKVSLEAKLSKKTVTEGEGCEVMVKVTNVTKEDLPMVLAIIGLPGGFEPRHEQLKDLVKKEKIDFYEVIGRNIALYWRGFDKAGVAEFPIDVVATVPGSYTGPASRVFLYYTPEKQHWIDGLTGEIVPK